jgi:hypothetical protein
MLAWPLFANGQAINEYVNPLIQGLNIQPGVTVLSRLHPDYDPVGINIGALTILPSVDDTIGYDDNVTGTTIGRGSLRIDTNARVAAKTATNSSAVSMMLNVEDVEFTQLAKQSYTNWNANLLATHNFGQDDLTISAAHYNQNQTPRDIDLPDLDYPIAYRFDDLKANYTISTGHFQIQPVMDLQFYTYDNGTVVGVPYLQNYRDRTVYFPSVSATYEFADRRRAVLVFRDANALYYSGLAGEPKENYNDFSLLAGISYDTDGVIGLQFLAGYEERDFSSAAYRTIRAPIVEGSVTWTPSGLTTVTGTATRVIQDSAQDGTVAYTASRLRLELDHELFRNVLLTANIGYQLSENSQGGGNTSLFRAGTGVVWRLNRSLRLEADYMFSSRQTAEQFSQSYADDIFRLGLRLAI